jgi:hypothetical protein
MYTVPLSSVISDEDPMDEDMRRLAKDAIFDGFTMTDTFKHVARQLHLNVYHVQLEQFHDLELLGSVPASEKQSPATLIAERLIGIINQVHNNDTRGIRARKCQVIMNYKHNKRICFRQVGVIVDSMCVRRASPWKIRQTAILGKYLKAW